MKHWEIIADRLSKAGWSLGCVSAIDSNGRAIWIVDAHRGDGKRFIVRADEKVTAFVELESQLNPDRAQCRTTPYFFIDWCLRGWQNPTRAKFVRPLPELHLTLFPQG